MTHAEDPQFPVAELKDMINIIQRLIADGKWEKSIFLLSTPAMLVLVLLVLIINVT